MATNIYGTAIKNTIPSFTASTFVLLPELSNAARHMAHCAFVFRKKKIEKRRKNKIFLQLLASYSLLLVSLLSIIR